MSPRIRSRNGRSMEMRENKSCWIWEICMMQKLFDIKTSSQPAGVCCSTKFRAGCLVYWKPYTEHAYVDKNTAQLNTGMSSGRKHLNLVAKYWNRIQTRRMLCNIRNLKITQYFVRFWLPKYLWPERHILSVGRSKFQTEKFALWKTKAKRLSVSFVAIEWVPLHESHYQLVAVCQTSGWTEDKCYFIVIMLFVTLDLWGNSFLFPVWKYFLKSVATFFFYLATWPLWMRFLLSDVFFRCIFIFGSDGLYFARSLSLSVSFALILRMLWIKDTCVAVFDVKASKTPLDFVEGLIGTSMIAYSMDLCVVLHWQHLIMNGFVKSIHFTFYFPSFPSLSLFHSNHLCFFSFTFS